MPRERRFYELFARQGQLVADTLSELAKSLLEGRSRHPRLRDLEHQCDEVAQEIYLLANRTFVTPFDQEDIHALASGLDDIVDLAEEVGDKLELYRVQRPSVHARQLGECLESAGGEIARATANLEGFRGLEEARLRIHQLENEGDRLSRDALGELFSDEQRSAADLVKWKDIYDLLEETMDSCERVANLLTTLATKNA